jgi:GT2 family glycosyltransferase
MSGGLAIVLIGRNEGDRLGRCLDSVMLRGAPVVYVDSGSTDGSAQLARARGASVVELDASTPFTAGRARNAGFEKAAACLPDVEMVQFVDGDCELVSGWLEVGEGVLRTSPNVAAVCGRVRELHREQTIFNRLCDLEWDAPPGDARACGGNAMIRASAFRETGGFVPGLIAGEEPELCLRLRERGWRILRSEQDMVLHDAAMTRFTQWWRRALRSGWAYAEGAAMHGRSPERHSIREAGSVFFWGALLPAAALILAWPSRGWSMLLLAGYLALAVRIYFRATGRGTSARDARLLAAFTVLSKIPQALGQAQFAVLRVFGKRRRIVDWRVAD